MAALTEGAPSDGVDMAESVSSLSLEDLGELIGSTSAEGPSPIADEAGTDQDIDDDEDGDDSGDDSEDDSEDDIGDDEEDN